MKITDVKLHTLEHPTLTQIRYRFKQVPGLRRIQYTHTRRPTDTPMQTHILEVETDEGITGRIAPTSINKYQLDILKTHAIGESPSPANGSSRCCIRAPAGSTEPRPGSASSTTVSGTSPARPPACPSTP